MATKLYTALFLLFTLVAGAQNSAFKRTYGGNGYTVGNSLAQTPDGGYICVGASTAYNLQGTNDVFIFKIDSTGAVQWTKNYGGPNIDIANHIIKTPDNRYLVCGYTNSKGNGGYDVYLIKINSLGDTLWTKTYGGSDWDFGNEVYVAPSGSIYIAAQTYGFGNGTPNGLLIKADVNGNELFKAPFGGTGEEGFNAIAGGFNNTIALAGYTTSYGAGNKDAYFILTDTLGNKVDSLVYGGAREDMINDISPATGNGLVAGGYTHSYNADSLRDIYEIRIDSLFDHQWHTNYGGAAANVVIQSQNTFEYGIGGYSTNNGGPVNTAFLWVGTTPPGDYLPYFCPFILFNSKSEVINDMVKVANGWCAIGTSENSGPGLSSAIVMKSNFNLSACNSGIVLDVEEDEVINVHAVLMPNPTTGAVRMQFNNPAKQANLTVYNALGQVVFTQGFTNTTLVNADLSALENGLYFVSLVTDGKLTTQRLVVAK